MERFVAIVTSHSESENKTDKSTDFDASAGAAISIILWRAIEEAVAPSTIDDVLRLEARTYMGKLMTEAIVNVHHRGLTRANRYRRRTRRVGTIRRGINALLRILTG